MDWRARIREAFAGSPDVPDAEVVEELAQHLRAMYHAARAEGCSREEADARLAPQLEAWRPDAAALRHRRSRAPAVEPPPPSASALTGLGHDLRYAARLLRRQPHVAALVFVTMALGIGVSTVLFSVTYGVLLKPLPWADADRLVALKETRGGMPPRFQSFTNTAYLAWREQSSTLDGFAAWSTRQVTLTGAGDPDRIQVTAATASLFRVLGAHPLVGALFDESDEQAAVVVLSEGLWRQRFGRDPGAVGRSVQLDGTAYTIAGVLPDRLAYPDHRSLLGANPAGDRRGAGRHRLRAARGRDAPRAHVLRAAPRGPRLRAFLRSQRQARDGRSRAHARPARGRARARARAAPDNARSPLHGGHVGAPADPRRIHRRVRAGLTRCGRGHDCGAGLAASRHGSVLRRARHADPRRPSVQGGRQRRGAARGHRQRDLRAPVSRRHARRRQASRRFLGTGPTRGDGDRRGRRREVRRGSRCVAAGNVLPAWPVHRTCPVAGGAPAGARGG